jgi:glucokinase
MGRHALAIDLGGTKIAAAVVRDDGTVIAHATRPTEAMKGGDWVLNRIKEAALEALDASQLTPNTLVGVGMGTPGIVDATTGVMLSETVNIPDWKGRNLKAELERVLHLPAFVDNDANVAALGEWVFGAGKGARHLVYITIGTGVGGAIILNGALWRGANFAAGELGHVPVNPDGPRCGCGGYGCVEMFVSGPAIAQRAKEFVRRGVKSALADIPSDDITAERVAVAAQQGDALARFILAEAGKYLGIALAGIVNLLNPERLIVGGGVAQAGEWLLEPARWELRRRALPTATETIQLVPAALGINAGILGAAALVFHALDKSG